MTRQKRVQCSKKPVTRYTACACNVFYKIPLTCGRVYIRQTGRCFNETAREHRLAVRNKSEGYLAAHRIRCGCDPLLGLTKFINKANKIKGK